MSPLAAATARLAAAGVPSPHHDAEALTAHVLGCTRVELLTRDVPAVLPALDALIARRAAREPLQHLLGSTGFRHLELLVGPGVFTPRPETEVLVGLVLPRCGPGVRLVDLGSGSGAIALAVAQEAPGTQVHAVERADAAREWLQRNVAATGLPVTVHAGDLRSWALGPGAHDRVDIVVSNPPYVPEGAPVDPEVAYDPPAAVWGGPDGLAGPLAVAAAALRLLRPGGLLAVEHDSSHAAEYATALEQAGWATVTGHRDLAGRARCTTATRAADECGLRTAPPGERGGR